MGRGVAVAGRWRGWWQRGFATPPAGGGGSGEGVKQSEDPLPTTPTTTAPLDGDGNPRQVGGDGEACQVASDAIFSPQAPGGRLLTGVLDHHVCAILLFEDCPLSDGAWSPVQGIDQPFLLQTLS